MYTVEIWLLLVYKGLTNVSNSLQQDLNELAAIVRGELPKLSRAILCALITVDVHGRDMITGMVQSKVCIPTFCQIYVTEINDYKQRLIV